MRFIIQGVLQRTRVIQYMREELPEAEVFIDTKGNHWQGTIDTYMHAGRDPVVILEDDLKLCKRFRSRITSAIFQDPNITTTFFHLPGGIWPYTKRPKVLNNPKRIQDCSWGAQCLYFPAGVALGVANWMRRNGPKPTQGLKDPAVGRYLVEQGLPLKVWHYSLVQHLALPTATHGWSDVKVRKSHVFIDDYVSTD